MRILGLKRALHCFLHTSGTGADDFETSMSRASRVTRDRKQEVSRKHLRRPGRLCEPVRAFHGTFERARRLRVHDTNRAKQVGLLHPELRQELPHRPPGLQHDEQ